MTFADVRTKLVDFLKQVKGIGEVHEYRRHTTTWEQFYSRHVHDGRVNNWEVTRTAAAEMIDAVQNAAGNEPYFQDRHSILIVGHMSLCDETQSEKDFQDLVDAVVKIFRLNTLLGGNIILLPSTIQVPVIDHRMFGGVLVHYAELNFSAIERVGG